MVGVHGCARVALSKPYLYLHVAGQLGQLVALAVVHVECLTWQTDPGGEVVDLLVVNARHDEVGAALQLRGAPEKRGAGPLLPLEDALGPSSVRWTYVAMPKVPDM